MNKFQARFIESVLKKDKQISWRSIGGEICTIESFSMFRIQQLTQSIYCSSRLSCSSTAFYNYCGLIVVIFSIIYCFYDCWYSVSLSLIIGKRNRFPSMHLLIYEQANRMESNYYPLVKFQWMTRWKSCFRWRF